MRLWPVALLLLSGCAIFDGPVPLRDSAAFSVTIVDELPGKTYPGQAGVAACNPAGDNCALFILRSHYPICLTHEIRHAFEGPFHGSRPSDESCYDY